jgi:hypothetical protein
MGGIKSLGDIDFASYEDQRKLVSLALMIVA